MGNSKCSKSKLAGSDDWTSIRIVSSECGVTPISNNIKAVDLNRSVLFIVF